MILSFVVIDREGNWKAYTSSWQYMYVCYVFETWNRGLCCVISFIYCVWNALHCPFLHTMYVTQVTWWVKVVTQVMEGWLGVWISMLAS